MMVHVLGWEWIFQMDVVGVVIVVEVKGRDNLELSMKDTEENNEDIVDGSHKFLSNLVANIVFEVEMDNVAKGKVCSSYF